MKLAFRSDVLSSKYGNKLHLLSRHDATTYSVQTTLFEIIFLLDSYSWRSLKLFGWYGKSDTFTKHLSGRLSFVFVVSGLPAIVVDASKSFSFPRCSFIRIVSSTATGSVSLMHGFTQDKRTAYLFSTPRARSQQQTEILTHLLKKLAPVNGISGVLYLVDPMWIFSWRIWEEPSCRVGAHAPPKYKSNSTSGRGARASYRTMLPEISARRSLLEPNVRYLSPGREGE